MRLLLDNNLSLRLGDRLIAAGWDVVHVGALGRRAAPDRTVLDAAHRDDRVLVSADTDFGSILAASHATSPSVVLVRRLVGRRVDELAGILLTNLPTVAEDLKNGCVVVIETDTMRVRPLPI